MSKFDRKHSIFVNHHKAIAFASCSLMGMLALQPALALNVSDKRADDKANQKSQLVCTGISPEQLITDQQRLNAPAIGIDKHIDDKHSDQPIIRYPNGDGGNLLAQQDPQNQNSNPLGAAEPSDEREVFFEADRLDQLDDGETIIASGNVEMLSNGERLRADKVIWNRNSDEVEAQGNVRIIDKDGNRFYGNDVMITDSLRDGVINNILIVMEAGGRLVAEKAVREDGVITLDNTAYSPCTVQYSDGSDKNPSWQVKASRIIYDPDNKRISYENARMELFGLPLIPLPGFSHPAGKSRDSGFLVPNVRLSEANGLELEVPYYFNLAPNRDLTATANFYSQTLPMLSVQYRALTSNGAYQISGFVTAGERIQIAGRPAPISNAEIFRGYIDAIGRFQLDANWALSGSIRRTSDRTFLRRYDISRDDRLRSTINAERIGDNSYFSLAGWATQTLRVNDPQGQVPVALPVLGWRFRPQDEILGGKAELQLNTLAIARTDGQDTQRAFIQGRWDMKRILPMGQLVTLTALGRGDLYHSEDNELTSTLLYRGSSGFEGRMHASFAADVQWPFIGEAFGGTQILTPRIQMVATPILDSGDIANEDARAIELQDINLFSINRLPGYDLVEDGVRLVYGVDWSLRIPQFTINTNIGQSYSLNNREAFIPDGTGLPNKLSDYVGRTDIRYQDFLKLTHRFRLDKDNFKIRRNEIDATIGDRENYFQLGYIRYNRDIDISLEDLRDREELRFASRLKFLDYWSVFGSAVIDLTDFEEDPQRISDGFEPVRTRFGMGYDDDCVSFRITWRRDYFATGDAERGNTFLFRIAFRSFGY